jgi:hypothetical protein
MTVSASELQTGVPGGVSHLAHPSVIEKPAAVKHDTRDAFLEQPFRDQPANNVRPGYVATARAVAESSLHGRFHTRCRHNGSPRRVIDRLGRDVRQTSEHRQSWAFGGPDYFLALPQRDPMAPIFLSLYLHRRINQNLNKADEVI